MNDRCLVGLAMVLFAAGIVIWTCKSSSAADPESQVRVKDDPSFSADIQPVFSASCAMGGCHGGGSAQAGLLLSPGPAYANLVNAASTEDPSKKRVLPGDAAKSYLVLKVEGNQSSGSRMPPAGPLAANTIRNIKNWISRGAKNN